MAESDYQYVARLDELPDGEPYGLTIGGELAVIVRQGEQVFGLGGHCPHTGMRLADGIVAEGRLVCFYHGANYDLATGRNIVERLRGGRFETHDIPRYGVRVEDGKVWIATRPDHVTESGA